MQLAMTPVLLAGALLKTTAWPAKIRLACCWMGSVFLAVAINSMLMKVSAKPAIHHVNDVTQTDPDV